MSMTRSVLSILLLMGILIGPSLVTADTITVIDDRGKAIEVPYPLERGVFLVENAMNTMYAVGGAGEITGRGTVWKEEIKAPFFRAIDPNYDKMQIVSSENNQVDLESLSAADPQVVFLWSADWSDDNSKTIEETLGVPVYGVFIDSLDDMKKQPLTFAKMLGDESAGQKVVDTMNKYIDIVDQKTGTVEPADRPRVFWMWGDVYGTAGLHSTANDLIKMSGGVNILEDSDIGDKWIEHPVLNIETISELDPDVIYMWYNEKLDPSDVMSGEGDFETWKDLSAVKNGRVYEVSDPFVFDFHSPRLPLALTAMAKNLYPDMYTDIDLNQTVDSYFADVYNVHYPGFAPA